MLSVKKVQNLKDPKTQSQRLRAVLWLLWEQNTGNLEPDEFLEWYNLQMEKFILVVKNKLKAR